MSKRQKGHLNLRSLATQDSRTQWLRDGTDHDFWLEEEEPAIQGKRLPQSRRTKASSGSLLHP